MQTRGFRRLAATAVMALLAAVVVGRPAAADESTHESGDLMTVTGRLVDAETYNQLFTMHGVTMIFLVVMPAVPLALLLI